MITCPLCQKSLVRQDPWTNQCPTQAPWNSEGIIGSHFKEYIMMSYANNRVYLAYLMPFSFSFNDRAALVEAYAISLSSRPLITHIEPQSNLIYSAHHANYQDFLNMIQRIPKLKAFL